MRVDPLLTVSVLAFAFAYFNLGVLHLLRRKRPDLYIAVPVTCGFAVRVAAVLVVSLSPFAQSLRSPDEEEWLRRAQSLSEHGVLSSQSIDALGSSLHVWLLSLQLRVEFPDTALRVVQVGIATIGLLLLATAVHDLASPRRARVAAWILAIEPTSIFFSGLLHKEALMLLAIGLVVLGGVRLWHDGSARALCVAMLGFAVAVSTRPYAGWFLVAAVIALLIHGAVRSGRKRQTAPLLLGVLASMLVILMIPTLARLSSPESLQTLQTSQEANVVDPTANLGLEPVDFSSRDSVVRDLPQRIRDVLLRPYPWQLSTLRQQVGLLGTVFALSTLIYLFIILWVAAGSIMRRAAPLIYPTVFLLAAYALSSANAGTSFRYRTQLVALAIAILIVLREERAHDRRAVSIQSGAPSPSAAARAAA